MKFVKNFKKAFTIIEIVVVVAVIAILSGVSVGIYFGVTNGSPEKEAVSTQETVLTLWNDFIGDSSKYNADIESKAKEFCLTYAPAKGINVDLNYRVMEYDDFVSTIIPHEDSEEVFRAYDPSGNQKEAAIIKIGTSYPSYFISTSYSVVKVSEPVADGNLLVDELVNDAYVTESGLLEKYGLNENSSIEDFDSIFELSNINVDGQVKRGIKYVRYLVNDVNDRGEGEFKPRFCVFGRANRTLNEDCEDTYLPANFEFNYNGSTFLVNDFDLIETKNDKDYYYDPDHLYTKYADNDTYISGYDSKITYDFANNKMDSESSPLSTAKNQYVVAEQQISYDAYLNLGGDKNSAGNDSNKEEINIYVPKDELPDRPVIDESTDMDDIIKNYPICLYFAEQVEIVIEKMPTITKILKWLGITKTVFQYLYFNDFDVVNTFINAENFYELLINSVDKSVYLYISEGAVLDSVLTIPEHFKLVVHHTPDVEVSNGVENDVRLKNLESFKNFSKDVTKMELKNYSSTKGTPYQVTWPEKAVKSFRIGSNGLLDFITGSQLFVESNCYPTSNNGWKETWDGYKPTPWGYTISEYGEIINEGVIRLRGNAEARITGVIRSETGNGKIIVTDNAVISEPFRITDYLGHENNKNLYTNRNIFPTDFYYLDSIRCKLILNENARYLGLITIRDFRNATSTSITYLGSIDLVSSQAYDNVSDNKKYGSVFKLAGINSQFEKSYDQNTKRALFNLTAGKLSYGYAWVDCLRWFTEVGNGYGSEISPAYRLFSTKMTGFKLSNIDLVINSGCEFNFGGEAFNGGNSGYPELEVLPNASITIKEGATMNIGENSYIYINNYFGSSSYFDKYHNEINNTDFYSNSTNKNVRSALIDAFNKLKSIYETSNKPMLDIQGNITIDRNLNLLRAVPSMVTQTCPQVHRHTGINYHCDTPLTTEIIYHQYVIQSSIFNWNNSKISIKNDISYNYSSVQYSYYIGSSLKEHKHHNGLRLGCKTCNGKVEVMVEESAIVNNDVAYAYYGDDSSFDYPPFALTF